MPLQRSVELELLGALRTMVGLKLRKFSSRVAITEQDLKLISKAYQLVLVLPGLVVVHGLAGRLLGATQLAPEKGCEKTDLIV